MEEIKREIVTDSLTSSDLRRSWEVLNYLIIRKRGGDDQRMNNSKAAKFLVDTNEKI